MKKIKLIIADDHPVFTDGIVAALKDFDDIDVVAVAHTGNNLITMAKQHHHDLILTDIQMPHKDGIEATKEILKILPQSKIIAFTMLNESIHIKKMLEAGVCGYILKNIDKNDLVNVIRKVDSGDKHFDSEVMQQLVNTYNNTQNPQEVLTKREREILILIAQGFTDKEIAEKVFLSPLTIITHRKNILIKLSLKNKVELTRFALENNIK